MPVQQIRVSGAESSGDNAREHQDLAAERIRNLGKSRGTNQDNVELKDLKQEKGLKYKEKNDASDDTKAKKNGEDGKKEAGKKEDNVKKGSSGKNGKDKKGKNKRKKSKDVEAESYSEFGLHLPQAPTGWRKCIHVLLFLFMLGNDIADFVSDWLFFTDVVIAEKGLVYGPPDPAAVWCLLLFSIIGTFTFIFECANLWWESFRNNPWIDSDWLSAFVIWIEDVPQVLISLYIGLCREEPISVFQLSKAAVVLIGVVIRIIVTSVKYCNKKAVKSHHHVKIKAVIMLGIIIEAMAAGVIFFLTQTERNNTGDVAFRVPSSVIEDTYNDQRYFTDVSLFLHDADLMRHDANTNKFVVSWIRLTHLSKIRDQDTANFKIAYGVDTANNLNLAISERKGENDSWILAECYSISNTSGKITELTNTLCPSPNMLKNPTIIYIALQFDKPGSVFKKKVFGDIFINIKRNNSGACTDVDKYEDAIENNKSYPPTAFTFHYYRTNETIHYNDTRHLLHQNGERRFYRNEDYDLINVAQVWKTGWMECACNGNLAPLSDLNLPLTCS